MTGTTQRVILQAKLLRQFDMIIAKATILTPSYACHSKTDGAQNDVKRGLQQEERDHEDPGAQTN